MYSNFIKRILDLLFSALLLVVLSPVLLAISLLIKITDGGPVFVPGLVRIGENHEKFYMFKFRTMIFNADRYLKHDKDFYKLWVKLDGKLPDSQDPRITWVGKFLRKTDLDELPQLLNIIKGDMSFVGPRPISTREYKDLINCGRRNLLNRMLSVRPGLTGLWQVSGRNYVQGIERLHLECQYAKSVTFWRDLMIVCKTPFVIITRYGIL